MIQLKEGDKAPEFSCINEKGEIITLSLFVDKQVVLYFYPKDNTPGCTLQACNLRDNHQALIDAGYVVIGVSPDNENKHIGFISKFHLPFTLLADTDHKVAIAYGVWGEKSFIGKKYMGINRTTFVIDNQGIITKIISKVKTTDHTSQILNL